MLLRYNKTFFLCAFQSYCFAGSQQQVFFPCASLAVIQFRFMHVLFISWDSLKIEMNTHCHNWMKTKTTKYNKNFEFIAHRSWFVLLGSRAFIICIDFVHVYFIWWFNGLDNSSMKTFEFVWKIKILFFHGDTFRITITLRYYIFCRILFL